MTLFDPYAPIEEIREQWGMPATPATSATPAPEKTIYVASVADVAAPAPQKLERSAPQGRGVSSDMRHGFALGDRPKTWTGNIVSLDAWRRLSEWEKHGPDGRRWNGVTRQWDVAD